MDKINYFLVLEKRIGDYNLIDINKLDICNSYVPNVIEAIDSFTSKYTEKEIRDSIERSNMTQANYLMGNLKIVSDAKHNFRVLTKDVFTEIINFQKSEENITRDLKNKMFGIYKKIVENIFEDKGFIQGMLDRFKLALKNDNKKEIFSIIEEIPYSKSRMIYFTIYDEEYKKKQEMLRKLEKLDDVA